MKQRLARIPFSPDKCPVFYGWPIMAAGALGILMSVPGQTMGVSVFTDYLMDALRLSRGQLSSAYMLGTIGSACLLPAAGKLCDKFGSRCTAVSAGVALALVLLLLSRSDRIAGATAGLLDISATMAAFGVISLCFLALRFCGQGVLTLASHNMMAKWFDRKRGLASGFSGLCVTLGFSAAPLGLDLLIRHFGWRGAWMALAGASGCVFALFAWTFYRDNPEDCGLRPDGVAPDSLIADNPPENEAAHTREQALRTPAFWVFSLGLALFGMYMTGLTFHIVSIFETSDMTRGEAVMIFLPGSVLAVLTHMLAGWLSDRMALGWLLAAMLAALVVSATGLFLLEPGLPMALLIVGNGVAGGLFGLLSAVTWVRFFGRRHLGAISGVHMSVNVFCSAIGPVLFSQSLGWGGSYDIAACVCAGMAGILFLCSFRVSEPAPGEFVAGDFDRDRPSNPTAKIIAKRGALDNATKE